MIDDRLFHSSGALDIHGVKWDGICVESSYLLKCKGLKYDSLLKFSNNILEKDKSFWTKRMKYEINRPGSKHVSKPSYM